MDNVKNVLPLLLGQEPEHGDEIGFDVVEGAPIADEALFMLHGLEVKRCGAGVLICCILIC